jgi:hypothetical protein
LWYFSFTSTIARPRLIEISSPRKLRLVPVKGYFAAE